MKPFWRKYKCHACNHEFDGLHYEYDEPLYECKSCASADTEVLSEERLGKPLTVVNREISFAKGAVKSTVDGKHYANRKQWDDHLKAHGCVEVGNETKELFKNRGIEGDFSCRKELTEATREVLSRRGLN